MIVDMVDSETNNMNMELKLMNAEDIISGEAFPIEIVIKKKVQKIKRFIYNNIMLNEEISRKRKSVEFNAMEATCAVLLAYNYITNYTELYNRLLYMEQNKNSYEHILKFNNDTDLSNYLDDIRLKENIMDSFITNFNNSISKLELSSDNIKIIYISGKKNKHPEITKLNSDLHKLESKSDIYIQLQNNEFIGISIKQSKDCTKSNYSVQKMFEKEVDKTLTQIKKNYLTEQGFPNFNSADRSKVNALFYPQNKENPYMIKLKEEIENNKEEIKKFLIEKLYCINANYPVYEFDGKSIKHLNESIVNIPNVEFKEWTDYYIQKNGKERCAAKLFYILIISEKKYRVEVRWKGDCYVSPQFQIHEE
jgi:hypothetical protein